MDMKKFVSGLIIGGIITIGSQSFAWTNASSHMIGINQIGVILDKSYSKMKSIDERLNTMESKMDKMQDELEWINSNTR